MIIPEHYQVDPLRETGGRTASGTKPTRQLPANRQATENCGLPTPIRILTGVWSTFVVILVITGSHSRQVILTPIPENYRGETVLW